MVFCKREVGSRPIALNMSEVIQCNEMLRKQRYTIQESFRGGKNRVYFLKNARFPWKFKSYCSREVFSAIGRELTSRLQKTRGQKNDSGARAFVAKYDNRNSQLASVFALIFPKWPLHRTFSDRFSAEGWQKLIVNQITEVVVRNDIEPLPKCSDSVFRQLP